MNAIEIAQSILLEKFDLPGTDAKVYEFIIRFMEKNKYTPVLKEIAQAVDVFEHKERALTSLSTASRVQTRLAKMGLIEIPKNPGRDRRIEGRIKVRDIRVIRNEETP